MIRTFTPRGWAMILLATAGLAATPLLTDALPLMVLVNETRSLPRGLYVRQPGETIRRGAAAAAVQPVAARADLLSLGAPSDMLLLKRVAAVGGDRVCRQGDRVVTPMADVRVLARDRRGVALTGWPQCRRLEPGEVFLLGETEESFDSRYFGPVHRKDLRGVFSAAATW